MFECREDATDYLKSFERKYTAWLPKWLAVNRRLLFKLIGRRLSTKRFRKRSISESILVCVKATQRCESSLEFIES